MIFVEQFYSLSSNRNTHKHAHAPVNARTQFHPPRHEPVPVHAHTLIPHARAHTDEYLFCFLYNVDGFFYHRNKVCWSSEFNSWRNFVVDVQHLQEALAFTLKKNAKPLTSSLRQYTLTDNASMTLVTIIFLNYTLSLDHMQILN